MVRFADEHGAMVIAEGVERKEEYDMVKSLGVHLVQGFYVHKPSQNAVGKASLRIAPVLTDQAAP
jgi:EAL domain-containing protein (putative c-di-GMP-specific phosphodiesterase class I)